MNRSLFDNGHINVKGHMHTMTMISAYFLPSGRGVTYQEMCAYNQMMFVHYLAGQNNGEHKDPGFMFSVVLN